MKVRCVLIAVLSAIAVAASGATTAAGTAAKPKEVKATGMAARIEAMAEKLVPQEKLNKAMGFFGPVTKKYLPVFKQFNTEYLAATKKMPVIVKYVPEAENALAEAKAMKVPAKYEAEKAEYIKMASAFVTMLRLSTALYTPQ